METVEEKVDNTRLGNIRKQFEGVIPASWDLTTLGETFKWRSGGTPLRTNPRFYGGDIPWLIIGDLNDGLVTEAATTITEEGLASSATRWVEEGSVLLAMYGSIGKLGIAGKRMTTNQAIAFTKADPNDAKYLFYYLMYSRESLASLGKGATQKNISQAVIKEYPFPLAPLPEQRRIVSAIETQLGRLDAAVARLHAAKAKLKRYKQAVLKAAVEPDEEWERMTLGDLIRIKSGDGLFKAQRNDTGEYPVYGGNGLTGRHDSYMFEERQLIIGRVGVHCGNVHVTQPKSWVTDNAFVVSFDRTKCDLEYLEFYLRSLDLNQYANSTAQPVISGGKLYPVEVALPPLRLQHKLAESLRSNLSSSDEMEATLDAQLLQSTRLRQAVLKRAFEGRLA
jgi:type I restriction enzyme, S subunit